MGKERHNNNHNKQLEGKGMEEVREAFKRGVECIYYVREKKMKIAIPISLGIAAFFYVLYIF